MDLSLFDLHCDTAFEIYRNKKSLVSNDLAVSFDKSEKYGRYCQTFAIWSDSSLDDDSAFDQFNSICNYLSADISKASLPDSISYILAVEDARILNNDIKRLYHLKSCNIKILTLTWKGVSCIGGAYDTNVSLTDFGEQVVRKCFELGIIIDISHASRETAQRVFELNDKRYPIIASHSNSYSVFPHNRNLTDNEIRQMIDRGGLIGLNLYYKHLGLDEDSSETRTLDRIFEHIDLVLSLGGENTICLGCDFDGAQTPKCLKNISDLDKIAEKMLSKGYGEEIVNKIFWDNANNFANKNLLYK